VQASDWTCAVEAEVFDQFASMLQKDVASTIRRFLALQVRGTSASMKTVKQLQQALSDRGTPTIATMMNGLNILSSSDLRSSLNKIQTPVNWLLGDRDAIVPVDLASALKALLPQADIQVLEGAGHAPFISHPEVFAQLIDNLALQYSS
jgi:pimeloyl-[acyl-carrier protein] methyl ester esterase